MDGRDKPGRDGLGAAAKVPFVTCVPPEKSFPKIRFLAPFSLWRRGCVAKLTSGFLGLSFRRGGVAAWRLGVRVCPHIKLTTWGLFACKPARAAAIALAVLCLFGGASREASAQFIQQGPKLVGSSAVNISQQGSAIALSAEGTSPS